MNNEQLAESFKARVAKLRDAIIKLNRTIEDDPQHRGDMLQLFDTETSFIIVKFISKRECAGGELDVSWIAKDLLDSPGFAVLVDVLREGSTRADNQSRLLTFFYND